MDQGVRAAVRRHLDRQPSIEELALRSESFRSLCADLAEAELALRRWEATPSPIQAARCMEYRMLVESLENELRAAIGAAAGTGKTTGGESRSS